MKGMAVKIEDRYQNIGELIRGCEEAIFKATSDYAKANSDNYKSLKNINNNSNKSIKYRDAGYIEEDKSPKYGCIIILIICIFVIILIMVSKLPKYNTITMDETTSTEMTEVNTEKSVSNDITEAESYEFKFGEDPKEEDIINEEDYKVEKIKWRILSVDEENNEVLLLSDKILDTLPLFDEKNDENLSWETSDLRQWLNGSDEDDFYNKAFSKDEQAEIISKTIESNSNANDEDGDGNYEHQDIITEDKIYLLSSEDIIKTVLILYGKVVCYINNMWGEKEVLDLPYVLN
ncbi:MAG: DUF6273 domain-containing protein [Eubacterium sp.]|nr:DUF6273 domain-containing protein [Eubacterium sp.]